MARRFLLLVGLCILLGLATKAGGAEPSQSPWITREGAVALLIESKPEWKTQVEVLRDTMPPMGIFDDVNQDEWYAPYLEVAFQEGLVTATDFHRSFHPGELLNQGDALVLAARYRANGNKSALPSEEPDHPLTVQLHVQAAADMGLALPTPLETWNTMPRSQWIALMESAGITNAGAIAVVVPEKPKVVAVAPVALRPLQPSRPPVARVAQTPSSFVYQRTAPVRPVAQPSYVANPSGARPVSSNDVFIPSAAAAEARPTTPTYSVPTPTYTAPTTSQQTFGTTPTYVPNPPGARPVSSNNRPTTAVTSNGAGSTSTSNSNDRPAAANNKFSITIPSLGVNDLTITHPADVTTQKGLLAPLQYGVGHLFGYPGAGGTILVYGHSSSFSWDVSEYTKIFRQINKLNPGDRVTVNYGGKAYTYEVTYKHAVDASDMSAYKKNNGEELILYTCWPPDDIKQRYLVHAKPV